MSSAKDWLEMECRRMSVVRGFVYKMNRIGPRTDPCGTPKLSKVGCESLLLLVTVDSTQKYDRIMVRWGGAQSENHN